MRPGFLSCGTGPHVFVGLEIPTTENLGTSHTREWYDDDDGSHNAPGPFVQVRRTERKHLTVNRRIEWTTTFELLDSYGRQTVGNPHSRVSATYQYRITRSLACHYL